MNKYFLTLYAYDPIANEVRSTTRRIDAKTAKEAVEKIITKGFSVDDVRGVWKQVGWVDKELHIQEFDE